MKICIIYQMMKMKSKEFCKKKDGFGINELLGIGAALIIAGFVVIPGLRTFAGEVITKLNSWWTTNIMGSIFPTT